MAAAAGRGHPDPEGVPDHSAVLEGCNDGKLLYQLCNQCGKPTFNPAHRCRQCTSAGLDEGYQMLSNVIDIELADVRVGLPVEVAFHNLGNRTLPYFRPR